MSRYLTRNRTSSRLRSRQIVKNYKDDSTLMHENLLPMYENSIVLVEKLRVPKRKLPVYKCISPENSTKNPSEVYEFEFDVNDSKERLKKKRKRRPVVKKTIVRKTKKNTFEKRNVQKQEVHKEESINVESKETVKESPSESLQNKVSVEPMVENQLQKEPVKNVEKKIEEKKGEPVVQSDIPKDKSQEQIKDKTHSKPTIVSVQGLSNKIITIVDNSQKSNSEDFKPFRPTNIFGNKLMVQQKNVPDQSLFEKSLSPIMKSSENFNLDSPWRAPQLLTFSQVRNVFQSTPQNKKYDISGKRLVRSVLNDSKNYGNIKSSRKFGTEITNIEHSLQSNVVEETNKQIITKSENVPPNIQLTSDIDSRMNVSKFDDTENKENSVLTSRSPKKFYKKGLKNVKTLSPRKIISTRIDEYKENLDPQPGSAGIKIDEYKENLDPQPGSAGIKIDEYKENLDPQPGPSGITIDEYKENLDPQPGPSGIKIDEYKENLDPQPGPSGIKIDEYKENLDPQPGPSGIKIDEYKENLDPQPGPSGIKIDEYKENLDPQPGPSGIKIDEYKENLNPRPGPSGLQSNRTFNEQRVLRQTNLNNLLNIMEMPQSTTIKTFHGFFDDGQSTPVSRKPVVKFHEPDAELKHAFGFDDDSNEDISPIEHNVTKDEQKDEKAVETSVEKRDVKPFARISINDLKNNLLPRKPLGNVRNKRNIKSKKLETKKSPVKSKQNVQIDIANFSDTFDVLSEISETPTMSASDIPIFADLEPSHFTKPPQHSYKRKRAVRFDFLEESYEEEDEDAFMHKAKRKEVDKMKMEQEKRLMEWVQGINRTFDEIDEHELVVE